MEREIIKREESHRGSLLYMVVPCYNEEAVLAETTKRLTAKLKDMIARKKISAGSRILYVNDGSKDATWRLIEQFHKADKMISGLNLSRNRGHQNAVLAGLMYAKDRADMVISMDADLQDDINAIEKMVDRYHEGLDVVYGVRSDRRKDSGFKRKTAELFYKLMLKMGVEIIYNHADFRLMGKRVLEELAEYKEVNLFLRGIIPLIGFPSGQVLYERGERFAGESKYPVKKMMSFALDGITSFSVKPIRMIMAVGFVIFCISIIILIWSLIVHFMGNTVLGWSSTIVSIWALGGLQLLAIGIVGEYIGKMYLETKARPRFAIKDVLDD